MAGYLFLLGEIKDANDKVIKNANAIYNEVFSTGTYSTRMPVSYTHLDVYKRQVLRSSTSTTASSMPMVSPLIRPEY